MAWWSTSWLHYWLGRNAAFDWRGGTRLGRTKTCLATRLLTHGSVRNSWCRQEPLDLVVERNYDINKQRKYIVRACSHGFYIFSTYTNALTYLNGDSSGVSFGNPLIHLHILDISQMCQIQNTDFCDFVILYFGRWNIKKIGKIIDIIQLLLL